MAGVGRGAGVRACDMQTGPCNHCTPWGPRRVTGPPWPQPWLHRGDTLATLHALSCITDSPSPSEMDIPPSPPPQANHPAHAVTASMTQEPQTRPMTKPLREEGLPSLNSTSHSVHSSPAMSRVWQVWFWHGDQGTVVERLELS